MAIRLWVVAQRTEQITQSSSAMYMRVIRLLLEALSVYTAIVIAILVCFSCKTFGLFIVTDMVSVDRREPVPLLPLPPPFFALSLLSQLD